MALIPPDVGLRMRLQNDATILQPTAPVPEIPSDLPELRVGQVFSARIQEVLPDNTFKALVAGKQLTLQLPEGAKAGDTLDLVVIDRTPRLVIARVAEPTVAGTTAELDKFTTLSPAAQMIGNLLVPEGETPAPAPLNRGQPLLSAPPASAAELAPALQKAVAQSGLFYESHQAQWIAGKLPLEQVLQEPQGQLSAPATLMEHGVPPPVLGNDFGSMRASAEPPREDARVRTATTESEAPMIGRPRPEVALRGDERVEAPPSRDPQASHAAQAVPAELRPIVQQQLDAVATQRLIWHGEAWPNQPLEWEIVREEERRTTSATAEENSWRTNLRLDTPRLGHIDASLHLTGNGIALRIAADDESSAADLRAALPALAKSLEAAGIPLLSAQVSHGGE